MSPWTQAIRSGQTSAARSMKLIGESGAKFAALRSSPCS